VTDEQKPSAPLPQEPSAPEPQPRPPDPGLLGSEQRQPPAADNLLIHEAVKGGIEPDWTGRFRIEKDEK
jgi:hypothetical protein